MLYKVLILYKDPQLQQRWISEVCELSQFGQEEILTCLNERKKMIAYYNK
jgi:hypothetical protein